MKSLILIRRMYANKNQSLWIVNVNYIYLIFNYFTANEVIIFSVI